MSPNDALIDKVYSVIGQVCVLWAEIDFHLMNILDMLAEYNSYHYREDAVSTPFDTLLRNMDMKGKCEAAIFMFHGVKEDPRIYEDAKSILGTIISNDLRNLRNRLIHDDWVPDEDYIVRVHYRTKIETPQARQRLPTVRLTTPYRTPDELQAVATQFLEAAESVSMLYDRISNIVMQRR